MLTRPEPQATLLGFYRRVHPAVYGWRHIARLAPELPEVTDFRSNAFNWAMGCTLIYSSLFGIGKIVFQEWTAGIVLLAIAAVAGYLVFWNLSRQGWKTFSGSQPVGEASPIEPGQTPRTYAN